MRPPLSPVLVPPVRRLAGILAYLLAPVVLATAGCQEAEAPTDPGAGSALVTAAGTTLVFRQLSASATHTCGVTSDDRAYCWGLNYYGQLGNGGFAGGGIARPTAAVATRRFLEVRAGVDFSCGLTTDNRVYCWGLNTDGQLGAGTDVLYSLDPLPLAGGRRFRQVRTGAAHACAITLADVTFCWGANGDGQVGDGTRLDRRAPVRLAGGLTLRQVSPGYFHTCGLTSTKRAWCWGLNATGQLGIRNSITQLRPAGVVDGLSFEVIGAGMTHTCAVTTDHKAYCWGGNQYGQLGDGTTSRRSRPTAVAGGLTFAGVSAGGAHTCGVTSGKRAYCWGWNYYGQVGDGTDGVWRRLTPTAVAGGHLFDRVVAAFAPFSCGADTDGRGYCWGQNIEGYLGDGTTIDRSSPVPIADPL